jgi:hypothetical protein
MIIPQCTLVSNHAVHMHTGFFIDQYKKKIKGQRLIREQDIYTKVCRGILMYHKCSLKTETEQFWIFNL